MEKGRREWKMEEENGKIQEGRTETRGREEVKERGMRQEEQRFGRL